MNNRILYHVLGGNDPLLKFLIATSTDFIKGCPADDHASEDDEDIEQVTRKPKSLNAYQVISNQSFSKYDHWPKQIMSKYTQRRTLEGCKWKTQFDAQNAKFIFVLLDLNASQNPIILNLNSLFKPNIST